MFHEDLFLTNETGKRLFHTYAKDLPIIDYHCHLQPKDIYENKVFEDLGEMWLSGDHYKWRAMRTFGIDERYITGTQTSYYEKYMQFAKILPQLVGNPLYIWCALELKRYFGIEEPLCESNADEIYQRTKKMIQDEKMSPLWCMDRCKVELVSTTEDPIDTLAYHKMLREENRTRVRVITAFRPDQALYAEKDAFRHYIPKLAKAAQQPIESFEQMMDALEKRLLYFKEFGTTVSDSGIEDLHFEEYTNVEIEDIFIKASRGVALTQSEINKYRSAFIINMAGLYDKHGFVMQLHIGTYQGANKSREASIGAACGFDCIDDGTAVQSVGQVLDRLTKLNQLPKTILYPLDAMKIELWAVLAAGFCEGPTRAKVQLGAPWWFNDHVYGIQRQFAACANLYPIALSVGMLTDSRSFLSYPRFELYRRVLCNYLGELVERHEYFSGEEALKEIIRKICYQNAKDFFEF